MKNSISLYVSFRIFGTDLDPQLISDTLGVQPDHAHYAGDHPKNDPQYPPYKHGMWSIKSKVSPQEPLETHLDEILTILEPYRDYIRELKTTFTVDIGFTLFGQNGFALSSDLLQRIASLGAAFGGTVYP